MQTEGIFKKYIHTTNGDIIECGIPQVVVYSVGFDYTVETKSELFRKGKRYCFSCIVDTPADMDDDIESDLRWKFDCPDGPISFSGINEKSIRIEFKHELS